MFYTFTPHGTRLHAAHGDRAVRRAYGAIAVIIIIIIVSLCKPRRTAGNAGTRPNDGTVVESRLARRDRTDSYAAPDTRYTLPLRTGHARALRAHVARDSMRRTMRRVPSLFYHHRVSNVIDPDNRHYRSVIDGRNPASIGSF